MQYRPEIDGLRALAVLPVIAFHAGAAGFSGGFVGVDVFFVISGYLITTILLDDLAAGRFSLARFYERRARRILPALFVVMAACLPFAHLWMTPDLFQDFARTAAAVALFVSNLLFIAELDYFAPAAEANPLLHTWSLAVEEQFYILFPPALWGLWRLGGGRAALWGTAALAAVSFAFSEWAWRIWPAESFFFLPSRAWELLAGALCAFGLRGRAGPFAPAAGGALALAGLAAILAAVVLYDRDTPFPSAWAALPVGGSVAVILFARADTLAAGLLRLRPVVGLGLISYSAYLWHQPLFAFARLRAPAEPTPTVMAALALAALALAALTWRFVEQPFRHHRARAPLLPRRGQVFAAAGAGIAAFAAFGAFGELSEGRARLWLAQADPGARATYLLMQEARAITRRSDDGACRFNLDRLSPAAIQRLRACAAAHGPGVAVLGDSHAIDLTEALLAASDTPFLFGLGRGGCRPDAPEPGCDYATIAAFLAEAPGTFSHLIYESAAQHLIADEDGRSSEDLFLPYAPDDAMDPDAFTVLTGRIARTGAYLEGLARHVPVIWLTPRIEPHLPDAWLIAQGCDFPFALRPGQAELFARVDAAIAARPPAPGLRVVNQMQAVDFRMPQDYMTCAAHHWTDADHLSATGRLRFGQALAPLLIPAPR